MVTEATTIEEYVHLVEEYRMLVCRICSSGIRPGNGIKRHFRGHGVKGRLLADIEDYSSLMELQDPSDGQLPDDGSAPIAQLPKLRGYGCQSCRFLTISRKSMQQHYREAHHTLASASPNYAKVYLQTWLRNKFTRYWVVEEDDGAGGADHGECLPKDSVFNAMVADYTVKMEAHNAEWLRKGDIEEGIDRDSAWVKRTKWGRHFGSRDKVRIMEAAQWVNSKDARSRQSQDEAAAQEEALLTQLGRSFDRETQRWCWRLDNVPVETLQLLGSISPTALTGVPFGRKGTEEAMRKYRSIGHRYLSFSLRAHRLGREEAWEQLAIRFTDEQWCLLGDIVYELDGNGGSSQDSGFFSRGQASEGVDGDEGSGDSDDDNGDDNRSVDNSSPGPDEGPLDGAVFGFLISSIKQNVGGDVYASPLLCFCAALGIRGQPLGFTEPQLYTGLLAGIMWWARLVFLEAAFVDQGDELEDISVEAVLRFREEHAKWMCINTYSVASTIIGWMAYGKGYRNKTGGQATVRWSEDGQTLFHGGEAIGVEDLKRTMRGMVAEAEGTLDRIMAGSWEKVKRRLELGRIADSLVRIGAGQSFATVPRNRWLEPGPGKVMRLARAALWDAGRNRWKSQAAKKRLRWLRQFRELMLALVHTWAGQPGRGPEVTTMRHCDSWQLIRNVFVLDGQVMLVTDRDKAKAIRDNGRKVARFLPERIGKMMVAYVAWLLPFEQMLRSECKLPEARDEMLEFLWRDGSSKLWDTDRLSGILGRATQAGTGVRIGTARYRVVAIELGRRIQGLAMRQAESRIGDEDDGEEHIDIDPVTGESVDCRGSWNIVWDLQSTHGTKIARQHYAVHIGYPGRLQPEMIATFREISRLWHQFLEHEADGSSRRGVKRGAGVGESHQGASSQLEVGPVQGVEA